MMNKIELDHVLMEIMRGWDIPGLAVGAVQDNDVIYATGFGVQSLESRVPVTIDTVFSLQSVSKCFVATAVMQLVEQGILDLDAPLVQYLPYFNMADERYRLMTLRQALSHTSGMPDIDEYEYQELVAHPETDDGAAERFVRSLRDRQLVANPGERFSYSNIAYNLLGDLLAKVSGRCFERFMQEQILMPAGMANSTFLLDEVNQDSLALPHLFSPQMKVNPIYPYHRGDAPASSLHANLVDMCRWAITSLKRGLDPKQYLLSANSYDRMWTPVVSRGQQRPSLYEEMGLGWTLGHYKGWRTVSHGGAGFGGTSFFLIMPECNRAVVVLCNQESDAHFNVVEAAADALLDLKPQPGRVSWMVPISQALSKGGIEAATAWIFENINGRSEVYDLDQYALLNLSLQLYCAGKIDLAISVLGLNIQVFPDMIDAYLNQARLYQLKGETTQTRNCLQQALKIDPGNPQVIRLLEMEK